MLARTLARRLKNGCRRRRAWRVVLLMLLSLGGLAAELVPQARGQLPATRLSAIFPAGGLVGTDVELTLVGADLEGAAQLHFSHPGLSAVQKTQPVEGQPAPQPVANVFVVKIAPDTPLGVYELRAIGTYGISNPRAFVVGDRPEVSEVEPNNTLTQATEIPLGATVNGRCDPARDIDCFRFAATAGQRIVIDVLGERIDSRIDATLEVFDANGRQLAIDRDTHRRDPFYEFAAPADGVYLIKLYDFQFAGGADVVYRVSIGATPYIDFVLPPSAIAGTRTSFTLFGRNLPGSTPAEGVAVAGRPLEKLTVELDVPAAADQLTSDTLVTASGAFLDGFNYRLTTPAGSSNPVLIGFATAPVVAEVEPNETAPQAQKLTLPCEVAAQFAARGDVDWFEFQAQQGEVFRIEVLSSRLGLAADPWFAVEQVTVADGKETSKEIRAEDDAAENIGGLGFVTASPDAGFQFVAPAAGTYRIQLHDLYYETRGDPSLVYRLSLRKETPDFRLVALTEFPINAAQNPAPWTNLLRQGGTDVLTVLAERRDGFGGEIELSVEGLPAGVKCAGATLGPAQTRTALVLEAAEDAAPWTGAIVVKGVAKIGEQNVTHAARPGTVLHAAAARPAPSRIARDLALAVVAAKAPFLIQANPPSVAVVQGFQVPIAVQGTRRDDFKGVVSLTAAGLPVNVQNEAIPLPADQTAATVNLFVQNNAPPGRYTIYLQATAPVPFTKSAEGKDKKDVAVADASTPVQLTILPSPVVLEPQVPGNGAIKPGASLDVVVKLTRRNGFAGPVTLDLLLPANVANVTAEPVAVTAEQSEAKLTIQAAADATVGNHPRVAVRARAEVDGKPIETHQPIPFNVQP